MKKISIAQQAVIDEAMDYIDRARKYETYEEYFAAENKNYRKEWAEQFRKYWEDAKRGIALVECNSRTLQALSKMGIIEIIEDGRSYVDKIKIIDY